MSFFNVGDLLGSFTSGLRSVTSSINSVSSGSGIGGITSSVNNIRNSLGSLGSLFGHGGGSSSSSSSSGFGGYALDFGDDFQPNPLSSFDQVAYHFRLYTASQANGSGTQIVLAETGVTGYNIRDVEIKSIVGPNFTTRATNATEFTITITEPVGTSFLDALYLAATKNMIENYSKYVYYLELSFKGYNRDGSINTNLMSGASSGGTWVWPVQITFIDVQLDTGGGTYTIKAVAYYESIFDPNEELTTKETITVQAETVGEFFEQLGTIMTQKTVTNNGSNLFTFAFKLHAGPDGTDPASFKLVPKDAEKSNPAIRAYKEDGSHLVTGQIIMGTPIPDIVDAVFANSEEAQAMARNGKSSGDASSLSAGETRERIVYRVYPDAQITGFDSISKKYKKMVTYHIHPYITTKPVLEASETSSNSQQQLNAMIQRKGLVKKYDYLYTGLNTEVLQFDLRYNFAWTAQLPRLQGFRYSYDATSLFGRFNDVVHSDPTTYDTRLSGGSGTSVANTTGMGGLSQVASTTASGVINAVQGTMLTPLTAPFAGIISGVNATSAVVSNITNQIDNIGNIGSNLRSMVVGTAARASAAASIEAVPSANGTFYAEDLLSGSGSTVPISFTQTQEDARANAGTGFASDWDRGKPIYGIILDQLYGPYSADLMIITLEIRGDPYWFGPSGMEYLRIVGSTPESTGDRPDYRAGEHGFLINIRYPFRIQSDGTPEIRRQDVFSGLYMCTTVVHKFSNGEFKQTLNAYRCPLVETRDSTSSTSTNTSATTSSTTSTVNTRVDGTGATMTNSRDDGLGGWFINSGSSDS